MEARINQPNLFTPVVLAPKAEYTINSIRLEGQDRRLLDYLMSGKSIHCFHEAKRELRIGYLNSRISTLKNRHGFLISKKKVKVPDVNGELTACMEYWMSSEDRAYNLKREEQLTK